MPLSTAAIFGKRAIGRVATQDYAEWAVQMLLEGRDGFNVRMLSGLDPEVNIFEAEEHFRRTLRELEISEPNQAPAIRAYVYEMAEQIVAGNLEPRAGLEALREVCLAIGFDQELAIRRRLREISHSDLEYIFWRRMNESFLNTWLGDYKPTYRMVTGEILTFDERVKLKARQFIDGVKNGSNDEH